ncbi:TRAP transporter large permease [Pseudonocardia sp. MH-G8]|uniref:TRAP transporter large permease n=1 Tax=Pseudonocardia sp. MH-G8 TaxID=1854588 RepID=UPI0018E98067|nr:TRAP transporter large permease [Pseudonocardia sp. MH-G8]
MSAIILCSLLLALLILVGVPVGYAMGVAGAIGLWLYGGTEALTGILATAPYRQSASWLLVALPMFVLMAELMNTAGMSRRLFRAVDVWLRRVPGNLAVATVVSTALFGAISGSSSAATATMAKTAIPEMQRYRYDDRLALGTVASAGSLAMLIPPSVVLIIYGILAEVSIGDLFLAGIVPGILTAGLYVVVVMGWVRLRPGIVASERDLARVGASVGAEPDAPPSEEITWADRLASLRDLGPVLLLFVAIMGGIYSGLSTVTEAAAVGAGGALLLTLAGRSIDMRSFLRALAETAKTTGMVFTIIIGAHIFGYLLTLTRATESVVGFIEGLPVPPWVVLATLLVMYLLLGFVMDQLAILVLTIPLVFPVIVDLGYNPVWFGILIVKTVEIGLATPPLGLNVFIGSSISGISLSKGFRGVSRFVVADLLLLVLLALFPGIVLLPL